MSIRTVLLGTLGAAAISIAGIAVDAHSQEPGCGAGAGVVANAFVRSNPIYAYYFGGLQEYVTANAAHFPAEGAAVRCAGALSTAMLVSAIRLYDPAAQARRDQINAELESRGLGRGRQEPTPSSELLAASRQLRRLARSLAGMAQGDPTAYWTPVDEYEQLVIFAERTFWEFARTPDMRAILAQVEPLVRELAQLEYTAIHAQALALSGQNQSACSQGSAVGECGLLEAGRAVAAGNVAAARQAFLRVRQNDPSNEQLPLTEAIIWYKAGWLAEAEEANRRALAINANSFTAHDNLAFVLFDRQRVPEALRHWEAALVIRPDDPDALAGKAIALHVLNRTPEAVEVYRRAVRRDPRYLDCQLMRAEFFWSPGACDAAAPLIQQVR